MSRFVHIKAKEAEGEYYCQDCESWIDSGDLIVHEWDEPREFWGSPCSEHLAERLCPYCGSEAILDKYTWILDEDEEDEDEQFSFYPEGNK